MGQGSTRSETAEREEAVLSFWRENDIFQKTLNKSAPKGEFVFYDGPPFATGLPHSGSLLSSVIKDVIPRYKTMRGYHVRRRWGWDTHGLPIESLVEKELGLKTKKDILDVGIGIFNETARSFVLKYVSEWKRYVERVGRWVDFDNSYKTMDNSYIESVWWAIKELHKKGKLYEGKKVLMYCPHCETPLAKAEIAMDNTYKDITEEAVTVKFKIKNPEQHGLLPNTFVLAWTTTPWTLPGNVALAVAKDVTYIITEEEGVRYVLAKELYSGNGEIIKEFPGESLVGIEYEPLYAVEQVLAHQGKKYEILSADFVTTEEGTGVVHTAVMYGEDDFALGEKEHLPMVQLLEPNGTYNADAPKNLQGLYIKDAEKVIKKDLEERELLFEKKNNTHSYPHCYRCGTPLIYNAIASWFIDIQSVKQKMISENESVNWSPQHLKKGRFGHIVENAPDWTISRNRFWASPLPIWKASKRGVHVVGSLDELKSKTKKSGNEYFLMRHGQAQSNAGNKISSHVSDENTLTEKGKEQVEKTALRLKTKNIDLIVASPFVRTKQTAECVARSVGFTKDIIFDERLQEIDTGTFSGKTAQEYHAHFASLKEKFTKTPPEGENLSDMKKRLGEFLYELDSKYENKKILIVTHEYAIWLLESIARGADVDETVAMKEAIPEYYETGEARPFSFVPLPHNAQYELDFHRPYIDSISLVDEQGEPLTRIPEVVDCWLESGSMPFAEYHYPFENKKDFEKRAPGDFIAEYIAQTRTWFYYMHALGVLLFDRRAFKNVVSTGNVLAADGSKVSKSKQNYTDPYELFDTFGADAFRFYLMNSVVMQAEDMMFKDDELRETHNKVVNLLRNTLTFYELYKENAPPPQSSSDNLLDTWIIKRLDEVIDSTTEALDSYDTIRATRPMREFVDDFSTWYVRRSRDRIKGDDALRALGTMRYVLREFSKIIAPVMPFIAEDVFRSVRTDSDVESVHLAVWPSTKKGLFSKVFKKKDHSLLSLMQETRNTISAALKVRQLSAIKVRQPLQTLTVKNQLLKDRTDFIELIKDEVNVKEVVFDVSLEEEVMLDTNITPELQEEGEVRELLRTIQDLRKKAGLSPKDKAVLIFSEGTHLLEKYWEEIQATANLSRFEKGDVNDVKKS